MIINAEDGSEIIRIMLIKIEVILKTWVCFIVVVIFLITLSIMSK